MDEELTAAEIPKGKTMLRTGGEVRQSCAMSFTNHSLSILGVDDRQFESHSCPWTATHDVFIGPENGRRTREDRDRPRSRTRDGSRSRRDTSPRRDRERGDDRERRRDRDHERGPPRRENEKDGDDDRRWRDDGRRDERMAARREREGGERRSDRARDKDDKTRDKEEERWNVVDSDGRSKRLPPRDRERDRRDDKDDRDGRTREDRRDRDREREKEPAWMDSDVPNTFSGGILGGKGPDEGGMDSIQAWKKSMKEKEDRAHGVDAPKDPAFLEANHGPTGNSASAMLSESSAKEPLDEIQMFKMMMKKEQSGEDALSIPPPPGLSVQPTSAQQSPPSGPNGANSLLSLLTSSSGGVRIDPLAPTSIGKETTPDPSRTGSRFFPTPLAAQSASNSLATLDKQPVEPTALPAPQASYNPPAGPRLLSLGRGNIANPGSVPPLGQTPPSLPLGESQTLVSPPGLESNINVRSAPVEASRVQPFSPFDETPRLSQDQPPDLGQPTGFVSADRAAFGPAPDVNDPGGTRAIVPGVLHS